MRTGIKCTYMYSTLCANILHALLLHEILTFILCLSMTISFSIMTKKFFAIHCCEMYTVSIVLISMAMCSFWQKRQLVFTIHIALDCMHVYTVSHMHYYLYMCMYRERSTRFYPCGFIYI